MNYNTIATINGPHKIYLVQHQDTNKIFVKKILDVYNSDIYALLASTYITGIPNVVDYYEQENQLVVIEEYISGTSLQEKIDNADYSVDDVLNYMLDLCSILEKLHSMTPAIIHRDIKPSNIIITNYNHAVLLDFNAAKYHSDAPEDTVLLGTHGYAAPEQYGFGSSSPQTDIYAMGVILREMLAAINEPAYCFDIIDKCTRINPSERYKNISDLKAIISARLDTRKTTGKVKKKNSYLLPGFRTLTPWKMLVAAPWYIFIGWFCISAEFGEYSGIHLWFERFMVLDICLAFIFCSFNYLDVQRVIPLCSHRNRFVRLMGIILLDVAVIFCLLIILMVVESICFPL